MPQEPVSPIPQSVPTRRKAKTTTAQAPGKIPNNERPVGPDVCVIDRGEVYVRFVARGMRPRRVGPFPNHKAALRFKNAVASHFWNAITDAALASLQRKGR